MQSAFNIPIYVFMLHLHCPYFLFLFLFFYYFINLIVVRVGRYLGDHGVQESFIAVDPSLFTRLDTDTPVVPGYNRVTGRGVRSWFVGRDRSAEVLVEDKGGGRQWSGVEQRAPVLGTEVGRLCSGEHRHQHVPGEHQLRETDPQVQDLLVLPKSPDQRQDLVEIHFHN